MARSHPIHNPSGRSRSFVSRFARREPAMRTTRKAVLVSGAAVLLAVGIAWTIMGRAQGGAPGQPPPQRIGVVVTHVKPDMLQTYEDLIKNVANPALKKAGVPWRATWANQSGPGFTRISVAPLANYAELDQ